MNLYLTNTLSGKKELFKPIKDGKVGMYHCGPTVYNRAHIGNMRAYILADLLRRTFEYQGYKVKQVINITDVGHLVTDADEGEDKLEKAAKEKGEKINDIVEKYTNLFIDDIHKMNVNTTDTIFPRASKHIPEQIELIKKLEEKGFTYLTSDGVYFDTSLFKDYGKLGNINIKGLEEGARVEKNPEKKHFTDFALWKFSKPEDNRQQEWTSPWGIGFPGWHIECSAMAEKYLGETFDIHTSGVDHIPTHHNNEIAQSEGANEKPLANIWVHSNHITIDGTKMSKSLGNIYSLDDLKEKGFSPLAYRYFLLSGNYSSLINFSWEALEASSNALQKLTETLSRFSPHGKVISSYKEKFIEAINDDLNTSKALAVVWDILKDNEIANNDRRATIEDFDRVLGLSLQNLVKAEDQKRLNIPEDIQEMATKREKAREDKDFIKADALREFIEEAGYEVIDTDSGPLLRRK